MIHGYAVKEAGGKLEPFEYDPGALGRHEVEIEVESCGICHSDMSMMDNEWGISQFPFVPGHEVIGTIAEAGSDVDNLLVGDLVGLGWQSGYCMTCPSCLSGDHNLCASAKSTIVGHNGGFADRVRADAASVVRLPDGVDRESAGPLFCGGITVFNPLIQFDVKPTDRVGVIGIGGLGHLALQFYRAWGCEVTAFTTSNDKREAALEMGAHHVADTRNADDIASAAAGLDFVISTAIANLDWTSLLGVMNQRARLVMISAILEPLNLMNIPLALGQRSVAGSSVGSPATIAKMLEFAARHNIKPVVERMSFDEANDAIARLRKNDVRYRVVLSN